MRQALADDGFGPEHFVVGVLAGVLAIGLSWSHIWRRATGQFGVDDTD